MAFEVAYTGYQNQQENLCLMQLLAKQETIQIDELVEIVQCPMPPSCLPSKPTTQKLKEER